MQQTIGQFYNDQCPFTLDSEQQRVFRYTTYGGPFGATMAPVGGTDWLDKHLNKYPGGRLPEQNMTRRIVR